MSRFVKASECEEIIRVKTPNKNVKRFIIKYDGSYFAAITPKFHYAALGVLSMVFVPIIAIVSALIAAGKEFISYLAEFYSKDSICYLFNRLTKIEIGSVAVASKDELDYEEY